MGCGGDRPPREALKGQEAKIKALQEKAGPPGEDMLRNVKGPPSHVGFSPEEIGQWIQSAALNVGDLDARNMSESS
jgi:hypothetical protein